MSSTIEEAGCGSGPNRRELRRRAMMRAAHDLFLERGLDAVSLADVVRSSGGSLSTLYDLFENKEGLLAAIIDDYRAEWLAKVDAIVAAEDGPEATLSALAKILYCEYANATTIGLMRLVIAESLRNPHFAHRMFETAHLPVIHRLTGLFESWASQGIATIADPHVAAELFVGMARHIAQSRTLFGDPRCFPLPSPDAMIHDGVALFVAGYQLQS